MLEVVGEVRLLEWGAVVWSDVEGEQGACGGGSLPQMC